jgi:ribosomal protein L29
MKHKDKIAIFDAGLDELTKQIGEIRLKLTQLKLERFTKPAKNTREMKNLRLKLAVLLTALRQKELNHG